MPVDELTAQHYRAQQLLARRTVTQAQDLWSQVKPTSVLDSWLALLADVILALIRGQRAAARMAQPYLDALADEQGLDPADLRINPVAFSGTAADGRDLRSLLVQPALRALGLLGAGADERTAMLSGLESLTRIVDTEISDASRAADQVGMTANKGWVTYVRHVSLPACGRCIILAGRTYSWSTGFLRHPRCFPAGTTVSGPGTRAATRRWYEGELTVITTASGQELPATGNHPVLTDRGWLPANLLQPGDQVVRSLLTEGAVPLVVPDERQVPASIEDLWRPDAMAPLLKVPTTPEDFHGDGGNGEVDVVLADGLLRDRCTAASLQERVQEFLAGTAETRRALASLRVPAELLVGAGASADGFVGGGGLGSPLLRGHLRGADLSRIGVAADLDALLFESQADHVAARAVALAEAVFALSGEVGRGDLLDGQRDALAARWDAPGAYGSVKDRLGYARRGLDLLGRLAGQVELDSVVDVRRVAWSGHVYNLNSAEGWYAANNLIVSNCDCTMVPFREGDAVPASPKDLFEQMPEPDQRKAFTVAGAEAIKLGADLGQVVNARRGMTTAAGKAITTEGTTVRGIAGKRLGDLRKVKGERYRRSQKIRPMPEQILADADGDRDEAIRLLKRFAYIV